MTDSGNNGGKSGSSQSLWRNDQQQNSHHALLSAGSLKLRLNVKRPGDGLQNVVANKVAMENARILCVHPDPPTPANGETLIESFCRGDDFVAIYAQTPARSVRPHYQWRYVEPAEGVSGVELTLSMQTSLLDSNPKAMAFTSVPAAECLAYSGETWSLLDAGHDGPVAGASGIFLFRPEGAAVSYAEIVFPADFQGASAKRAEGAVEIRYELFPEFLEKGVIRKGRIQSLFLPRSGDEDLAVAACETLAAAAPPLTT